MLALSLPVAPSVNNAFINRKGGRGYGRIKSPSYRRWLKQADAYYTLQGLHRAPRITAPYSCKMVFPKLRGDLDGRAKLLLDWMVSRGLTIDDKHCRKLELEIDIEANGDLVWIRVQPWDLWGEK
jgi:Holliday junction resolvase RusA-like endonuclease